MVGWHHQPDGRELEQTPGVGDGREVWRAAVHGVAKNQTRLSSSTELSCCVLISYGLRDSGPFVTQAFVPEVLATPGAGAVSRGWTDRQLDGWEFQVTACWR